MEQGGLVFLSYSSNDRARIEPFYDYLNGKGLSVWMDVKRLRGGQNWDFEIKKALQQATIVIVFLSTNSVSKRGYVQKEIRIALDKAQEKLIDDIYIIPVLIDNGIVTPDHLSKIQCILCDVPNQMEAVYESVIAQMSKSDTNIKEIKGSSSINWNTLNYKESWDGLPGYDVSFQYHQFISLKYLNIDHVSRLISGWLFGQLMNERKVKIEQSSDLMNFAQEQFERQNTWDATCEEPLITEKMLSIVYNVYWYGAGAAHPNSFTKTFNFLIDPLILIEDFRNIFANEISAFEIIQGSARSQLKAFEIMDDEPGSEIYRLDEEWVDRGTESWDDFQSFFFKRDSIEIVFDPYSVATYALGRQIISIPYSLVWEHIYSHFKHALGIQYLR